MQTSKVVKSSNFQTCRDSLLTFIFSFLLYLCSLAPTISWGDSADLAMRMVEKRNIWEHQSRDYDLFQIPLSFMKYLPFGDLGWRANLISAIFGSIFLSLFYIFTRDVFSSRRVALMSTAILAVSHTFWLLCVIAEVYTFSLNLIYLAFLSYLKWKKTHQLSMLSITLFLAGINVSHHPSGLVVAFVILLFVTIDICNLHKRKFFVILPVFFLGAFVYVRDLIWRITQGEDFLQASRLIVPSNSFFDFNFATEFIKFSLSLIYNFPLIAIFLLVPVFLRRIRFFRFREVRDLAPVITYSCMILVAALIGTIPDKYNIYVLAYPCIAMLVGKSLDHLLSLFKFERHNRIKTVSLFLALLSISPSLYFITVGVANHYKIDVTGSRLIDYRDNNEYFLWPPKTGDYSPRNFAIDVLSDLPKRSTLIADYTLLTTLLYIQSAEGLRSDVDVVFVEDLLGVGVKQFLDDNNDRFPIFIASVTPARYYQIEIWSNHYKVVRRGVAYEVKKI